MHSTDAELYSAISQVAIGRADDPDGGIYKKTLKQEPIPLDHSGKVGTFWAYEYLFVKQDGANIDDDESLESLKLVKAYGTLTPNQ